VNRWSGPFEGVCDLSSIFCAYILRFSGDFLLCLLGTLMSVPSGAVNMDVEVPTDTGKTSPVRAPGDVAYGSHPPGTAPAGPPDSMNWSSAADHAPTSGQSAAGSMQVDPGATGDVSGQPLLVPVAAAAPPVPVVRKGRDAKEGPLQKLTVELIKTYRHINYVCAFFFSDVESVDASIVGLLHEEAKEGTAKRPTAQREEIQ